MATNLLLRKNLLIKFFFSNHHLFSSTLIELSANQLIQANRRQK